MPSAGAANDGESRRAAGGPARRYPGCIIGRGRCRMSRLPVGNEYFVLLRSPTCPYHGWLANAGATSQRSNSPGGWWG
jgi:hypothetical protein